MKQSHDILVPVYNGEQHLEKTLLCLFRQTYPNINVIVSDNASTDGTLDVLKRFEHYPRFKVIRNKVNLGMFQNWNLLLNQITAPTFTLISHDDLFSEDDAIVKAKRLLEVEDGCSAVFSDINYINGDGDLIFSKKFKRGQRFDTRKWLIKSLVTCRNKFGLPIAIRSEFSKGISFNERLKYAADLEFAANISLMQGQAAHLDEPLFEYRIHSGSNTLSKQVHALADMQEIASTHGIKLSFTQKLAQRFNFVLLTLMRTMFIHLHKFLKRGTAPK